MVLLTGKVKSHLIKKLATGRPSPPPPRAFFPEFPLIYVISGKLFGAHGQGLRMVGAEERDFYFYTKRILALSKLYFERLPAMSWTWLQISGDPVFKTLGRYMCLLFQRRRSLLVVCGIVALYGCYWLSRRNNTGKIQKCSAF